MILFNRIRITYNSYLSFTFWSDISLKSGKVLYKVFCGKKIIPKTECLFLITKVQIKWLLGRLKELKIENWENNYLGNIIIDGYEWEIELLQEEKLVKRIYGRNNSPEYFKDFIDSIEKLLQKKFGVGIP